MTPQDWISLCQLIATLVVGGFAGWIAFQQHWTSRNKLRLDLFEKRLKVYQSLQDMLAEAARSGDLSNESFLECKRKTLDADFLFGPDVVSYIKSVFERGAKLHVIETQLRAEHIHDQEQWSKIVAARESEFRWLVQQMTEMKAVFSPYLGFAQIRFD